MLDLYDFKEILSISLLLFLTIVIIALISLGITWVEIQVARWLGAEPIWVL